MATHITSPLYHNEYVYFTATHVPAADQYSGAYRADANPFDDPGSNPFSQSNNSAFSLDDVGGGNSAPSGGIANMSAYVADHDRRARDLEAKQRELEERERNLSAREAEVEQYKANWPPCAYPCNVRCFRVLSRPVTPRTPHAYCC